MKKAVLVGLIGMITLMSGLRAIAQTKVTFTMKSGFYAGDAKMPAGTYTLRQVQDEPDAYTLQNSSGSHTVFVLTQRSSKTSNGKPEILFNRYGTTDYLEGVETSTGNSIDIMPGVAEKIAAKKAAPQSHTVPVD